ncbi:MAG: hypothetical protein AAFX05_05435 [Planctomycetota bacterium]
MRCDRSCPSRPRAAVLAFLLLCMLGGLLSPDAGAQDSSETTLDRLAVSTLTRSALSRLRGVDDPSRSDLLIAAQSLRILRRLAPEDVELIRLEAAARSAADDDEGHLELARQLLVLEPQDAVAQLQVALHAIGKLQNADLRLAAYENFLGEAGAPLDPAVRSRLALDAAMLARENGQEQKFLEYLVLATTLDVTNKDAAALYASYFLPLSDDPIERFDILANVLLADPLDPSAHENIAIELMQHGAFTGALRFQSLLSGIIFQRGDVLNPQQTFDFALCTWVTRGPEAALSFISSLRQRLIDEEIAVREARARDGYEVGEMPVILLSLQVEFLRMAILVTHGLVEDADYEPDNLIKAFPAVEISILGRLGQNLEALNELDLMTPEEAERRGIDVDRVRQQLQESQLELDLQLLWLRLFSGFGFDNVELQLNRLEKDQAAGALPSDISPETFQRFRGWLAAVRGEEEEAHRLLDPLAETDDMARWALANLAETQGDENDAVMHYAILAQDDPRSALGAASWLRLNRIRREQRKPLVIRSASSNALDEAAIDLAPWLNQALSDANRLMALEVSAPKLEMTPLDPMELIVTVRNVSSWPLAVGETSPIPKRMMLSPRLTIGSVALSQGIEPYVLQIASRLRLEPKSEVTIRTDLMRGSVGRMLTSNALQRATVRSQVIQGFQPDMQGIYRPRALALTQLSPLMTSTHFDPSFPPEELASRISEASGPALMEAVVHARAIAARKSLAPGEDVEASRIETQLLSAIVGRLPSMSDLERAVTLAWLSEIASLNKAQFTPEVIDAFKTNPGRLSSTLLPAFVTSPNDEMLERYGESEDPDVRELVRLVRDAFPPGS